MQMSINRALIAFCMSISMGIGSMEIDSSSTSIAMETEKALSRKRRLEDNPTDEPIFFKKACKKQAMPAPLSAAVVVSPPSSPTMGYVNSAFYASPHHSWARQLCATYNETADQLRKHLVECRTSPEPHGSPCKDAEKALDDLLEILEQYDEERRTKETNAIAEELKKTEFATVEQLAQWLEAKSSKILALIMPKEDFALACPAIASSASCAVSLASEMPKNPKDKPITLVLETDSELALLDLMKLQLPPYQVSTMHVLPQGQVPSSAKFFATVSLENEDWENLSTSTPKDKSQEWNQYQMRKRAAHHKVKIANACRQFQLLQKGVYAHTKTMSEEEVKFSASGVLNAIGARKLSDSDVEMKVSASGVSNPDPGNVR